ncbi:hypothetical protein ACI1AR_004224 [Cronobacter dublinensis]|nr:DUF6453 family protein [Cronobacter dublinensis]MDI7387494.1 DUF6453 family protein [Cronobacter dublinensis]
MPGGLYIDLNDGGPAMAITAGLRCPSYCGYSSGSGNQYSVPGYIPGATVVFAPYVTAGIYFGGSTSLIPDMDVLTGVSQNANVLTFTAWSNYKMSGKIYPGTVWQILPASQSGNRGLYIADSTDFTVITDGATVGQCIYRGRITFTGAWAPPSTGYTRQSYAVFARWDAGGVVVEYDGNVIRAVAERNGDNIDATVTMDVVIFATGIAPVPGPGLNFFNSNGQCTFSTTKRPFLYSNTFYTPSGVATDIGDRYIMLGRYGAQTDVAGGWCNAKYQGLVRSGNTVRVGRGYIAARWTDKYSMDVNRTTGMNVLLLDNMY